MNLSEVKGASIGSLVRGYAEAAAAHGKASINGDYKTANCQYDTIAAVCRELRARGRDAQLSLLELPNNNKPSVRGWAATHALEFAPEQGEPVLEELPHSGGLPGFDAEMTLKEWRKGTLQFPW